jgi:hypothetical protein
MVKRATNTAYWDPVSLLEAMGVALGMAAAGDY